MIKGFISYSTLDRVKAGAVREALLTLGVDCFLAHEDISVSAQWKNTILAELKAAKVFVPLLSANFRASDWASQEIGVAVTRRGMLILPYSLDSGTHAYGFIAHLQSVRLPTTFDGSVFSAALATRFPREVIGHLLAKLEGARGWRHAEGLMKPLVPIFSLFTQAEVESFVRIANANEEIFCASLCRSTYIPAFLTEHRARVDPAQLAILEYQVENERRFPTP